MSQSQASMVCHEAERNCVLNQPVGANNRFCNKLKRVKEGIWLNYNDGHTENACRPSTPEEKQSDTCFLFNTTNSCQSCPANEVMRQGEDFKYYCDKPAYIISVPNPANPAETIDIICPILGCKLEITLAKKIGAECVRHSDGKIECLRCVDEAIWNGAKNICHSGVDTGCKLT